MRRILNQVLTDDAKVAFARRQFEQQTRLDYLKVKRLGASVWKTSKRNVQLQKANEQEFLERCSGNSFAWKYARWLEGRNDASLRQGCYGVSQKRSERFWGALPNDEFGDFDRIEDFDVDKAKYGKQFRPFAYFPLDDAHSFIELMSLGGLASCSVYINSDWYDPPGGSIPMPTAESEKCGTHSFTPIYDFETGMFRFDNSWGGEWGDDGSGSFSFKYFEQNVTEMLGFAGFMNQLPLDPESDVCVGWKWSLSEKFSIHGREIIEGKSGERIAWSFGTRRGNEFVIHEFFVWPTYRSRGMGRILAELMRQLCQEAKLAPRLRVPFVDCQGGQVEGVFAVAKMLGVELSESTNAFYCLDGIVDDNRPRTEFLIKRIPPPPAASPLEWIRKNNEQPLAEPFQVPVLFGTNRNLSTDDGQIAFGKGRGTDLTCGFRVVQVENVQRFGSAGRTWRESMVDFCVWLKSKFAEMERDDTKINILALDSFSSLTQFLHSDDVDRQHLVYVHGFNTPFESAMTQAARLKADLKLKGNLFLYSWPSGGNAASYSADEAAIEASLPYFSEFMSLVTKAVSGEPLSVLAHSMGNRLVARWTHTQSTIIPERKLKHVIFAAPDVDHDVFKYSLQSWNETFERATLYANSADIALQLSEIKHKFPRAGLIPPLVEVPGLEAILVQGFDLFDLAHGYFAQAGNTLHDMFVMLKFDASADDRPGTRRLLLGDSTSCWSISHR